MLCCFLLIITPGRAHNSLDCAPIRPFDSHQMLIKQKDISQGYVFCLVPPCKLKICNFAKNSINTSALLFFAHYHAGAGAQFAGLCTDPPVRFPSNAHKTKRHIARICLLFGTPIGNRTLVSAVRGRRLEPLDHEGKSILLCDNSIIFVHTQAKIDNLRIFYLMNFLIKNYQLHIDFYYLIM